MECEICHRHAEAQHAKRCDECGRVHCEHCTAFIVKDMVFCRECVADGMDEPE